MSSRAVRDAVAARIAANWTSCSVLDDNVNLTPPADGSSYLVVQYPIANEQQITVGSPGANLFRETGAFRLVLSIPTGDGVAWAIDWLDQLRTLFRGKQFASVHCYAPSPCVQDNSSYVPAGRLLLSASVPYYYDFLA
jgi:hypothetical protein